MKSNIDRRKLSLSTATRVIILTRQWYSLQLEKIIYAHFPSSRIHERKKWRQLKNLNTQQSSQFPSQKAHQSTRFSSRTQDIIADKRFLVLFFIFFYFQQKLIESIDSWIECSSISHQILSQCSVLLIEKMFKKIEINLTLFFLWLWFTYFEH